MTTSDPPPLATDPPGRPGEIAERRLHPAYLLISAGQTVRSAIPVAAALAFSPIRWWALGIGGVLVVLGAVTGWWFRRYSVSGQVLRIRSGLLARKEQTVPVHRITALDAHRGLVQRLFGVWGLRVQTPGDGERATVRLACLSGRALDELRAALADPGAGPGRSSPGAAGVPGARPPGEVIARLRTGRLLIAAVTGTSVPLLLAGAAGVWNRLQEILPGSVHRWLRQEILRDLTWLLALALLLLALLGAVLITSLRLARFTLVRDGDRLRISRGLLAQRSGTVIVDRIQAVRMVEGLWRRPFGLCALEVEVAGIGKDRDSERTLFPLLRVTEVPDLLARAVPELVAPLTGVQRVPARARRRYPTLPLLTGVVLSALALLLPGRWAVLAVVPVTVAVLVAWGQVRAAGLARTPQTVTLRWHRVLARHTVSARSPRVQLTHVTTTPFQRRADLAGIRLALSSGRGARLRHLDADTGRALQHTVGRRSRALPAAPTCPAGPTDPPGPAGPTEPTEPTGPTGPAVPAVPHIGPTPATYR
ncbi:PH domain-containing protein [Nakamurella alba]|uniref:PH domain-containing protein n=1 Tax=Nakamurella alba TaxID=2665158 RepID=UPI0018A92558|nr:PH domain-containing protein [Nakamurella alba]